MAINLLGKADTTLVKAATDAAMANVPLDMSPIHQRMMQARWMGMAGIAQGFIKAGEGIGKIAGALIQQSRQTTNMYDLADSWKIKSGEGDSKGAIPSQVIENYAVRMQGDEKMQKFTNQKTILCSRFSRIRFNKYTKNTNIQEHIDHIYYLASG